MKVLPIFNANPDHHADPDHIASHVASATPRLHYIDGLRGLAMLMVLLYHCWLFGGMWSVGLTVGTHRVDIAAVLSFGHIGVNLFLVLSGFCLYWPFVKNGRRREPTLAEFAWKRCRRILPPYYAALALFGGAALLAALHDHDPARLRYVLNWLWIHALMAQNLRPGYVLAINGSLWSLALEFQLYILFPVLVEAYRRFPARAVVWTIFAFCSLYRLFLVRGHFLPDDETAYVLAYSVFGRGFEFALGMAGAILVARHHAGLPWRLRVPDCLLAAAVIAGALAEGHREHFQPLTDAMWGLLFVALLVAASRAGTALHRALSSRLLVSLGIFSYSVYLIHLPLVLLLAGRIAALHLPDAAQALLMLGGVLPAMLLLGYGFHVLFERPFLSQSPSRIRRQSQDAPAVTD